MAGDELDMVQHPTLGELKFPKDMPFDERNKSIERLENQSDPSKTLALVSPEGRSPKLPAVNYGGGLSGGAATIDEGEEAMASGMQQLGKKYAEAGPGEIAAGAKDVFRGGQGRNVPRGLHRMVKGAGVTAAPAMANLVPIGLMSAPFATLGTLMGGAVGAEAGKYGSNALGASEDWSDVAGDIGSFAGGMAGGGAGSFLDKFSYEPVRNIPLPWWLGGGKLVNRNVAESAERPTAAQVRSLRTTLAGTPTDTPPPFDAPLPKPGSVPQPQEVPVRPPSPRPVKVMPMPAGTSTNTPISFQGELPPAPAEPPRGIPMIERTPPGEEGIKGSIARASGRLVLTPEEAAAQDRMLAIARTRASEHGLQYAAGMRPAGGGRVPFTAKNTETFEYPAPRARANSETPEPAQPIGSEAPKLTKAAKISESEVKNRPEWEAQQHEREIQRAKDILRNPEATDEERLHARRVIESTREMLKSGTFNRAAD